MAPPPLARWLLWQVPGWAVVAALAGAAVAVLEIPGWLAAGAVGAVVLKDLVLYPLVRESLRPARDHLVGARGRTLEPLAPRGYVKVHGQHWQAEAADGPVPEGAEVIVRGVRGITLLVEPAASPR